MLERYIVIVIMFLVIRNLKYQCILYSCV